MVSSKRSWVMALCGAWLAACGSDDSATRTAGEALAPGDPSTLGGPGGNLSPNGSGGSGSNLGMSGGGSSGAANAPADSDLPASSGQGGSAEVPPPSNEGDRYEDVGTNPFVMVAHDPLSTFAADVDTASYDIFRRDVNGGQLPQPRSVRLEEYVNYFRYAYPAPAFDADEPFSILLDTAAHPIRSGNTLLRVGIQGKAAPPETPKPANLVYLVDVFGSMRSSDKLPLAQQVLRQSLDLLQPTDTVSIVTYASDTRVRLEPTPVSERAPIVAQIDALSAGSGTAGASGIQLAYAQAEAGFIQGGINHVILCTDGDFNVGPSSNAELLALIREERRSGVTLTALGFGVGNLNDSMLEAVSNAGNGIYGVISSEQQAANYVQERLLSTLTLIAKDMKIQVEFNPLHVAAYRLLGYEDRAIADDDFRDDVVDAGEVGSEHQVTALYELVLAGQTLPQAEGTPPTVDGAAYDGAVEITTSELVRVKVRYKNVDAGETDPAFEVISALAADRVSADVAAPESDLGWAISVAALAEVLKQSPYATATDVAAIEPTFAAQSTRDADRTEFFTLFGQAKSMLAQ